MPGDRLIAAWTMGSPSVRRQAFGYDDQTNLSSISTYDSAGTSINTDGLHVSTMR